MSTQQSFTEEQLWQAFRYVSAEMSPEEAESFEDRMLANTDVCEAVAEATRLTGIIAVSDIKPDASLVCLAEDVSATRPWWSSVAASTAVCCCLMLIGLMTLRLQTVDESPSGHETVMESADGLADAELLVNAWVDSVSAEDVLDSDTVESVQADLDVPEWMIAAVTLSDIEGVDGDDMPVERLMPDDVELF